MALGGLFRSNREEMLWGGRKDIFYQQFATVEHADRSAIAREYRRDSSTELILLQAQACSNYNYDE